MTLPGPARWEAEAGRRRVRARPGRKWGIKRGCARLRGHLLRVPSPESHVWAWTGRAPSAGSRGDPPASASYQTLCPWGPAVGDPRGGQKSPQRVEGRECCPCGAAVAGGGLLAEREMGRKGTRRRSGVQGRGRLLSGFGAPEAWAWGPRGDGVASSGVRSGPPCPGLTAEPPPIPLDVFAVYFHCGPQ